eukprot:20198-Amphidinium_carterae.1
MDGVDVSVWTFAQNLHRALSTRQEDGFFVIGKGVQPVVEFVSTTGVGSDTNEHYQSSTYHVMSTNKDMCAYTKVAKRAKFAKRAKRQACNSPYIFTVPCPWFSLGVQRPRSQD